MSPMFRKEMAEARQKLDPRRVAPFLEETEVSHVVCQRNVPVMKGAERNIMFLHRRQELLDAPRPGRKNIRI